MCRGQKAGDSGDANAAEYDIESEGHSRRDQRHSRRHIPACRRPYAKRRDRFWALSCGGGENYGPCGVAHRAGHLHYRECQHDGCQQRDNGPVGAFGRQGLSQPACQGSGDRHVVGTYRTLSFGLSR